MRTCPARKLELLGRALVRVERHDGGALTIARLTREDFERVGAEDSYTEGVVDHLRSVEHTKVAALAREIGGADPGRILRRRSRCGRRTARSTCRPSPVRAAAAATARRPGSRPSSATTELVAFLREQIAAQLALSST